MVDHRQAGVGVYVGVAVAWEMLGCGGPVRITYAGTDHTGPRDALVASLTKPTFGGYFRLLGASFVSTRY